ncbi:hypothetical protein RHMOL_Rhmol01G0186300 [Rhododendron molle]|uniref:Uncharacterized protein n=1 Tax=Rhododendron molle TaxID=49168 RepID=A0ACC0Q2M7_RHOML|nr:hypothetical protein RHMOL_Rhmol01G0186300 [Rhododendron molle]
MVPPNGRRKPFKFFNFWPQHPEFGQILSNSWSEPLSAKLKRLKCVLKQLNLKNNSNISKRVLDVRAELCTLQERLFTSPSDEALCIQEKELVCEYVLLRTAEESFMKQRSRVKWLALGDQNTKFFHQKLCTHRARNTILSLQSTILSLTCRLSMGNA